MTASNKAMLVRTMLGKSDATRVSYDWAESAKKYMASKDFEVEDFARDNAVRNSIETALKNGALGLFLFYGHGEPDKMLSQAVIPVIDLDNVHLLQNKIVYVVACWTAKTLGKASEKYVRVYLGYKDEVVVWFDPPYKDHLEKCVNMGIRSMMEDADRTIGQARRRIIDEYDHWIDYYTIGDGATDSMSISFAADLRHNRDALSEIIGDASAKQG